MIALLRQPIIRRILVVCLSVGMVGCKQQPAADNVASPENSVANAAGHRPPAPGEAPASGNGATQTRQRDGADSERTAQPDRADSPLYFESMMETSGIDFRHTSGNSPEKAFPAANGSGVAAMDFDLDGRQDLYFANGTSFPISPAQNFPNDRVFRNSGDWTFADVTHLCGLESRGYSVGLAVADFNSDGFPDLYVTAVGENQLFCNQGDGTFAEVSAASGTNDPRWATSAAFADINNDGLPDLYVCNYAVWSLETNRYCGDRARGLRMFCSPTLVPPENDALFLNRGDGSFEDIAETAGINVRPGRSQGVITADFSEDGLIDIYVARDINPNSLLINQGNATFRDAGELSGTAYDHLGRAQAGMGIATADVDGNGLPDLFVTNYENEHNAFYENLGGGTFVETGTTRIPEGSLPFVGWGAAFADFDLDSRPDLIVTNGHTDDNLKDLGKEGQYLQPPGLWHNLQGSLSSIGARGGDYFAKLHCGRGLLIADLDNDGDSDVVIGHQDNHPELLKNESPRSDDHRSVELQLIGTASGRTAIGAVVTRPETNDNSMSSRLHQVFGGGSYASASDVRVIFAVDGHEPEAEAGIRWPDGSESIINGLMPGSQYAIIQPRMSGQPARAVLIPNE